MKCILATLVLAVISNLTSAQPTACNPQKDDLAEQALDGVQGWHSLYLVFVHYQDCDNGGTAERFSDLVVHLLASQWGKISDLETLTRQHKHFLQFVLHHVNATASSDELKQVAEYASRQCPTHLHSICTRISIHAKSAILESDKDSQGNKS